MNICCQGKTTNFNSNLFQRFTLIVIEHDHNRYRLNSEFSVMNNNNNNKLNCSYLNIVLHLMENNSQFPVEGSPLRSGWIVHFKYIFLKPVASSVLWFVCKPKQRSNISTFTRQNVSLPALKWISCSFVWPTETPNNSSS